jgi:hypothetical protein
VVIVVVDVIVIVVVCDTVVVDVDVDVVCGSVNVVVDVDVDVVCGTVNVVVGNVGIDVTVVVAGDAAVVVVVPGFAGSRMTNFNVRERVTAKIVKTTRDMQMILNQR